MTDREARITAFLAARGWRGAARAPLAADASFRRYERLRDGARRAVLMDAPPPREDVRPFLAIARILRGLGLSAPEILAADCQAGLLLLEDFGDTTYNSALAADPDREAALYTMAVDVLIELHRRFDGAAAAAPPYDLTLLLGEAGLLVDWYLPALRGTASSDALRDQYQGLWRDAFDRLAPLPETLVLRDYHVDNLMWLRGRAGVQACGLLDFQDAVIGSPAYDLVSLLEDARRDVPADLAAGLRRRYLDAFPDIDRDAFDHAHALYGAQRGAKILGIFTRLDRRDGKPGYLAHIPRVWRWLEGDLNHPALGDIRAWFDRELPPESRVTPPPRNAA
jgi:aminoglycoside/choline kinase family phosphotransferase